MNTTLRHPISPTLEVISSNQEHLLVGERLPIIEVMIEVDEWCEIVGKLMKEGAHFRLSRAPRRWHFLA